jgi:hypothetical protein
VFQGLLRDALTGDSLVIRPPGKGGTQRVLVTSSTARGQSGARRVGFRVQVFEDEVLKMLREINPRAILPAGDTNADRVLTLTGKLAHVEERVEKLKAKLLGEDDLDALIGPLRELDARRKALADELAVARREAANPVSEYWGEFGNLHDALRRAADQADARIRLRSALRRMVGGIWCLFVARGRWQYAAVQVWFTGGSHRDYLIRHARTPGSPGVATRSFVAPGADGLDLRKPNHARRLERVLAKLDVTAPG